MKLKRIITLANEAVSLRFKVMERSLRASGCELPLMVIPYNDQKFELPPNASWWEIPAVIEWLNAQHAHPMMRKYQCLTIDSYQFIDTDVVFLGNPAEVLQVHQGFITCCGHWRNTDHAVDKRTVDELSSRSTNWQTLVFNAGQFACDRALYSVDELIEVASSSENYATTINFPYHDQPGLNLLVNLADVKITNLTLPPLSLESSWAGDYEQEPEQCWTNPDLKPYLIHWAGTSMSGTRPLNNLVYQYLSLAERKEWDRLENIRARKIKGKRSYLRKIRGKISNLINF